MKDFEVSIIGGGIGGLCTAIALHEAGVRVQIFESAPAFAEIGAGISLGPNAQNALKALGLGDAVAAIATQSADRLFFEWRLGHGDTQTLIAQTICKQYGAASVHRAELLDTLVKRIPTHLAHFSKRLENLHQNQETGKVDLLFKDGSMHSTDLVVGSDGIHSAVRGALDPTKSGPSAKAGSEALKWSGSWAYRGLVPKQQFIDAVGGEMGPYYAEVSQMFLGTDRHILTFPIQGGETVNIVAFRTDRSQWPSRPSMKEGEPWIQETSKEAMLADFEGWGTDIINMLRCIERPSKWALHQIIPPLQSYVNGRVIVSGDAAHGGTPHQGAMAGQAIEDGLFLGRLLGHPDVNASNLTKAIGAVDAIRVPRANSVLVTSLEAGDAYEFAGPHADNLPALAQDLTTRFNHVWEYDHQDEYERLKAWLKAHLV